MVTSKINSKWWTGGQVSQVVEDLKVFVSQEAAYNQFSTNDLAVIAKLGTLQSSRGIGDPDRTRKLQSLIRILMSNKIIESVGYVVMYEGCQYCLVR